MTEFKNHISKLKSSVTPKRGKQFEKELDYFERLYTKFIKNKDNQYVNWNKINPPSKNIIVNYDQLSNNINQTELASKLVILKLNGGLGTSMGCTYPKSLIKLGKNTFLDTLIYQIEELNKKTNISIPLILLNSFYTHEETTKYLKIHHNSTNVNIKNLIQMKIPRIEKESLIPLCSKYDDPKECWNPSGHGGLYEAFKNYNIVEKLLSEGKEYLFISNIDNLGATADFKILNWLMSENIDFVMEVVEKTKADVKGGTLIEYDNKPKLFEISQCPPEYVEEFKSIKKFKIFNTNNLWISLRALKKFLDEDKMNELDIIVNPKTLIDKECIQLETAVGDAIKFFENAKGLVVSRDRFLPIKNCSDLFLLQSSLFEKNNSSVIPLKKNLPLIIFSDEFKKLSEYENRFPSIPNIEDLEQLTVEGDIIFGNNITLKGNVRIIANKGCCIHIPDGSIIENKIISGNLKIINF